jgi:hypothetical protein
LTEFPKNIGSGLSRRRESCYGVGEPKARIELRDLTQSLLPKSLGDWGLDHFCNSEFMLYFVNRLRMPDIHVPCLYDFGDSIEL